MIIFCIPTGPSGRNCTHGLEVDTKQFDGIFTCDCAGTAFHGDNCDLANTASTDSGPVVGAILGTVLLLVLALLVAWRQQVRRQLDKPFDFNAMYAKMQVTEPATTFPKNVESPLSENGLTYLEMLLF